MARAPGEGGGERRRAGQSYKARCTVCAGALGLERESWDGAARVWVGHLTCADCGRRYLDTCKRPGPRRDG